MNDAKETKEPESPPEDEAERSEEVPQYFRLEGP